MFFLPCALPLPVHHSTQEQCDIVSPRDSPISHHPVHAKTPTIHFHTKTKPRSTPFLCLMIGDDVMVHLVMVVEIWLLGSLLQCPTVKRPPQPPVPTGSPNFPHPAGGAAALLSLTYRHLSTDAKRTYLPPAALCVTCGQDWKPCVPPICLNFF